MLFVCLPNGAEHTTGTLFDRGVVNGAETILLRPVVSGTGPVGTALAYVLDNTAFNANDWVRVGDGSTSEYRQVAGADTDESVAIDLPLVRSHDAAAVAEEFARATVDYTAGALNPNPLHPIPSGSRRSTRTTEAGVQK